MAKDHTAAPDEDPIVRAFGPLAPTMLNETSLSPVWRLNFLANFFTGPIYRELQSRHGLSRPEFVVLFCLSHQPGLVARDICLLTGQPKNSISRAVSDLAAAGLLHRAEDAGDKRAKPLELSAGGAELLNEVLPLFEDRQRAMFADLTAEELRVFDQLAGKLIAAMPGWVKVE